MMDDGMAVEFDKIRKRQLVNETAEIRSNKKFAGDRVGQAQTLHCATVPIPASLTSETNESNIAVLYFNFGSLECRTQAWPPPSRYVPKHQRQ